MLITSKVQYRTADNFRGVKKLKNGDFREYKSRCLHCIHTLQ